MSGRSLAEQLTALERIQRHTWFRESALLAVIAMFGGLMLAGWIAPSPSSERGVSRGQVMLSRIVMALAILNGLCALLLQLSDGWSMFWLHWQGHP